jgi:hypothetical protein
MKAAELPDSEPATATPVSFSYLAAKFMEAIEKTLRTTDHCMPEQ